MHQNKILKKRCTFVSYIIHKHSFFKRYFFYFICRQMMTAVEQHSILLRDFINVRCAFRRFSQSFLCFQHDKMCKIKYACLTRFQQLSGLLVIIFNPLLNFPPTSCIYLCLFYVIFHMGMQDSEFVARSEQHQFDNLRSD